MLNIFLVFLVSVPGQVSGVFVDTSSNIPFNEEPIFANTESFIIKQILYSSLQPNAYSTGPVIIWKQN